MHTKFWSENMKGRDHSQSQGIGWRVMLKWILQKKGEKGWSGFNCLRIETSGRLL